MSVDEQLDMVYLPRRAPHWDFTAATAPGNGLFGEKRGRWFAHMKHDTGVRKWQYQLVLTACGISISRARPYWWIVQ